ncbi:low temperature requirement protein A [Cellulomonas humilata]|uniref:Low temperature requirement protein A n=2 Tax=Cellulomonas humilata TaxID=144055 RepID=A0A7Y6A4K4_9CELL|nr:low temperature requirement protein A [Cellulomonas humilata]
MTGRDPDEPRRTATPLELLFDLTFVAAFAQAADQAAHLLAEGHFGSAAVAFVFVTFAVCWSWVNFSWFASAFDTDDWFCRLTTMVQMIGVLVLALGVPAVFESIDSGAPLDNGVLVAGYIVMRVAVIAQLLRVAVQDPRHRRFVLAFAASIAVAQVGWTVVLFLHLTIGQLLPILVVLYVIELGAPVLSARLGRFPPWHAHHIAERYGLFVIITLGEVILGTIATVAAVVGRVGWSAEAVLVVVAGTGLVFGVWWSYFVVPMGDILHRHRRRAWVWGYGGIVIFASIAAMGAGLHVAGFVAGGEATIGVVQAVLTVAVPVLVTLVAYFAIYAGLVRAVDPFHLVLVGCAVVALAGAVVLAVLGAGFGACLILVMLAPAIVVIGYETVGHRHMAAAMERVLR